MKKIRQIIIMDIFFFILAFFINWFGDYLVYHLFTYSLIIYLFLITSGILCICKTWKFFSENHNKMINNIPVIILLVSIVIMLVPLTKIRTKVELNLYKEERMEIIRKIKNEEINIDEFGICILPSEYKRVSLSGEAIVYISSETEIIVGFWVFRGIMSRSKLIVYSSNGENGLKNNIENLNSVEKFDEKWFFVIIE